MAIIHIWGWRPEPDEETAQTRNSAALDGICERYLELFPNEHVEGVLGPPDRSDADDTIQIFVDCSFDVGLIKPASRKDDAERALTEVYRRHFPDRKWKVQTALR